MVVASVSIGPFSELRQAKVHNLDLSRRGDHDVGALDVAVDDVLLVRCLKTLGGLDGDVECLVELERALGDLVLDG